MAGLSSPAELDLTHLYRRTGGAVVQDLSHDRRPSAGEQVVLLDVRASHQPWHPLDQHRVFGEVAARGIDQRRVVGGRCTGAPWALEAVLKNLSASGLD